MPEGIKVIDAWCNLTPPELHEQFRSSPSYEVLKFAFKLFRMEDRMKYWTITPEDFFTEIMEPAGIDKVCIPLGPGAGLLGQRGYTFDLDLAGKFIGKYHHRFIGLIRVNPNNIMQSLYLIEKAVKEYGFKGVHLHPYSIGKPLNDRIYYPIYAKCCELDIALETQVGHSAELMPSAYGKPILLDDIALDFPELRIIGAHIGWPWTEEMIALAWKHPNVYIGTSAHAPKYWDPSLVRFINTRGQDKVLFGTDFPVIDHRRAMEEIETLNLREEAKRKLLRENAIKVFKL